MNPLSTEIKFGIAAAVAALFFGAGYMLASTIKDAEISDIKEANTTALNAAITTKNAAETRTHNLETKGDADTVISVEKYNKDISDAKASSTRTIADLRSDNVRLRVAVNRAASGSAVPGPASAAGGSDGETSQTLAPTVAARLAGRYADYNELVDQLDLAQRQLLIDRQVCSRELQVTPP